MNSRPIGIFDSGVGGLSVWHALRTAFPSESFVYVGDTARAPYGQLSAEILEQFNREIITFLQQNHCKFLVVACNTSCAILSNFLIHHCPLPYVGLINATAETITSTHPVGVLATPATASSHAYRNAIHQHSPHTPVIEIGCPDLVPLIENDQLDDPIADAVIEPYVTTLEKYGASSVIWGCSHYPFLRKLIERKLKNRPQFIDPAHCIVSAIRTTLSTQKMGNQSAIIGSTQFFVSGPAQPFEKFLFNRFTCVETVTGHVAFA